MPFAGVDVPKDAVPLVGVELSFTIVAIVSVALRVLTRTWLIKHLGFDDLFIVLSAVRMFPYRHLAGLYGDVTDSAWLMI